MIRILFWNINNIGSNALYPSPGKRARAGDDDPEWFPPPLQTPQELKDARARLAVFMGVVNGVRPHIISIAEVGTGAAAPPEGTPTNDDAMMKLLRALRNVSAFDDWRLVPPLISGEDGRAEAIAVFYRDTRLRFCGPWGWSGAGALPIPAAGGLGGYGSPWTGGGLNALPPGTVRVPAAGGVLRSVPFAQLAGQSRFTNALGAPIYFPDPGYRSPLLTTFREVDAPNRTIKLLSFHAPPEQVAIAPDPAASIAGTAALASIVEMTGPIAATEVRCIVGDFNISAWDDAADLVSFARLRAPGREYVQHLNPRGRATPGTPAPPVLVDGWPQAGYYATHTRPLTPLDPPSGANPWTDVGDNHAVQGYPGFGWADRLGGFGRYDAIDNIFTRHGAGAGGPATGFTIANPITGSPYTTPTTAPVPANVVRGTRVVTSQMAGQDAVFGLPDGVPEMPDDVGDEAFAVFRMWDRYGKIRSLSDHLPVVIDV